MSQGESTLGPFRSLVILFDIFIAGNNSYILHFFFFRYDGHRDRSKKSKSMLSMVGDNMLDPNIAAEEGQVLTDLLRLCCVVEQYEMY